MALFRCLLLLIILETLSSHGYKKFRRVLHPFPEFEEYHSQRLPSDIQVTTFLKLGETRTFDYLSEVSGLHLSFIVAACGQTVVWNLNYKNTTGGLENSLKKQVRTREVDLLHVASTPGHYILHLEVVDISGYIHLYVSTEMDGPEALRAHQGRSLMLRRQRNNRIGVKWEPSLVDPQCTEYCLIISGVKSYDTLCGAIADRYGTVKPGTNYRRPVAASQTVISWREDQDKYESDPVVICTGKKTQLLFNEAKKGGLYHFDLFAINRQTNFTYKLGSNETFYNSNIRAIPLKDGKLRFVHLRERDGEATLKFKVGRKAQKSLDIYVLPCGGAVDLEVTQRNEIVEARRMIESFGKISIPSPMIGSRYHIKIFNANRGEARKISGVQIFATIKSPLAVPIPDIPSTPAVEEYTSLRRCDSVTIGWLPSTGSKVAYYCLVVKEGKIRDEFRQPNQCGLESRMKKSFNFTKKICKDFKHNGQAVLIQKIDRLKPGRNYIVQITVRNKKGPTISYDLLQVHTRMKCDGSST